MTALRAKPGGRGKLSAAVHAHGGEMRAALFAELRPRAIVVPALRALHEKALWGRWEN